MTLTVELVGFVLFICAAAAGAWFRVESSLRAVKAELESRMVPIGMRAELTSAQLSEHKLHVAQTYVSREGLREQMEPLFAAVKDVGGQVRHMNERLDRVIDGSTAPPRRASKPA